MFQNLSRPSSVMSWTPPTKYSCVRADPGTQRGEHKKKEVQLLPLSSHVAFD